MDDGDAVLAGELLHRLLHLGVDREIDLRFAVHELLLLELGVDVEIALGLGDLRLELLELGGTGIEALDLLHHPVDPVTVRLEGILGSHHLFLHPVHRPLEAGVVLEDVADVDHRHMRRLRGGGRRDRSRGDGGCRRTLGYLGVSRGGYREDCTENRCQLPLHG